MSRWNAPRSSLVRPTRRSWSRTSPGYGTRRGSPRGWTCATRSRRSSSNGASAPGPECADVRAVLMPGGLGSRLAPLTTVLPKPLMPLSDRPIIDVLIRQLVRDHVEQIDISVGHLGSLIEAWVTNGEDYGVPIGFLY